MYLVSTEILSYDDANGDADDDGDGDWKAVDDAGRACWDLGGHADDDGDDAAGYRGDGGGGDACAGAGAGAVDGIGATGCR